MDSQQKAVVAFVFGDYASQILPVGGAGSFSAGAEPLHQLPPRAVWNFRRVSLFHGVAFDRVVPSIPVLRSGDLCAGPPLQGPRSSRAVATAAE